MAVKPFSFLVLCFLSFQITAQQKQAFNWYFPEKAGITFKDGAPKALPGGKISTPDPNNITLRPTESGAAISDSKGNLLFYTDGLTVWNRNHEVMPNGQGLMGGLSSSQPAVIVPEPGNGSRYYIFTTDDFQHILQNGLRYSVVDMCLAQGLGDVTATKNVLLADTVTEKLAITKHANGVDYWVVAHRHFSNAFYAFPVTRDGVQAPVTTYTGRVHESGMFAGTASAIGQMKISPDGKRIAVVNANTAGVIGDKAVLDLFAFDNTTGKLSNYKNLGAILYNDFSGFFGAYGIAFSPSGKSLYLSNYRGLMRMRVNNQEQWRLEYNMPYGPGSVLQPMGGMQLGPDGVIYIAKGETFLSAITSPDAESNDIGYESNRVFLGDHMGTYSLPSFYDGFDYTSLDPGCPVVPEDPGGIPSGCQSELYPNPAQERTTLRTFYSALKEVKIYDMTGRLIRHYTGIETNKLELILYQFSSGCYTVEATPEEGSRCILRLVKI